MLQAKITNNIVEYLIESDSIIKGLTVVPNGTKIGDADNGDGTFSTPLPKFDLNRSKEYLLGYTLKIVDGTKKALTAKYELASEGLLALTEKEYWDYMADNTTPTPTINDWAIANNRTLSEEIIAVGVMLDFVHKSGRIQTILVKRIKEIQTEDGYNKIKGVLDEIATFRDKTEMIANYDRLISILNNGVV